MSSASAPVAPGTAPEEPPALERARLARGADEAALAALYAERRGELLAFLVGMTRDPEAAEDLLQEAFVRLVREARAGRMPEQPRAWLYRVAANAAIDRGRRGQALARFLPRLWSRDEPEAPEAQALRAERDAELHAALGRLSADRRAALLLAARGFSGAEVAGLLGRSEGATRTLLCRARLELRDLLDPAEVAP
jgi:RNA polymerase sigma-70 factor (ECF subfamily)